MMVLANRVQKALHAGHSVFGRVLLPLGSWGIAVLNDGIERASAPEPKAMSLSSGFGVMTAVLKPKRRTSSVGKSIGDLTFRKFKIPSQIINEQVSGMVSSNATSTLNR